ncbi:MAG: ABC transporter substrate-binding protein [Alphaproteobacteria bacterium]|nr:ABC transporter substrate-binding protein [Alphaproteobacteria bacterium]
MRKFSGFAVGMAAALMLAATAATAENVKVGVVLTTSGGAAEFGQQILRGMELYLKEHPEALGGHDVELVIRDSKRPGGDIAKTATQELITRDEVDILAGYVFSPNAMAIAPMISQSKTPTVIMNAGTAWIPSMSPYFARVSFTMWQAGYNMGQYAATSLGAKTAAVGYTDYPPGKDSLAAFKTGFEAAGGKVVDEIPMGGPREVPDFTPWFQRVKDEKPDVFFVFVPAGNHATAVVKTYADLGMAAAGVKLIGPGDITQDTKLQGMGDAAVGMVTIHHYSADYDTPDNRAFVKAWKQAYGADSTPDFMAVGGWDGMAAIATVIRELDGNIEGDAAMQVLRGWTFDSPRGPISIDAETRDIVQNEQVHRVVKKGDRLGIEVIGQIEQVKDPCKELKIGKCGQ